MPQRERIAAASAGVDTSPTVGPDPMSAMSSPGTSEIIRASIGALQAAASWPPFTRLRCFLTTFICPIGAPEARSAARTRSPLSRTALSGKPTMTNPGKPGATCACTSTGTASIP